MNDYSEFAEEKPSNDAFAPLHKAVAEAKQFAKEIAEAEKQLSMKKAMLNGIIYGTLPKMMQDMKLNKFQTADGLDIDLKDDTTASITEENRGFCYQWLQDNSHGGMIKRNVSVAFGKGEEAKAKELIKLLADKYPNLSDAQTVHPQTLKAWAKEMMEKGKPVPEQFNVRQVKVAKIPGLKPKAVEESAG